MFYARLMCCLILGALAVGCGDGPIKKKVREDNNVPSACGDGILQPSESCDPQIVGGEGACPESCSATSCGSVVLTGSANDCTARCEAIPAECGLADGCCPAGCDEAADADCENTCGNGIVEPPETCDGNCAEICDDGDACTFDSGIGDFAACAVECSHRAITECLSGDGCCPQGCMDDDDCLAGPRCGNGVVEGQEICDGDCPTRCDDRDACTVDVLVGSAQNCDAECQFAAQAACVSGDGCCPNGCSYPGDTDCACIPETCNILGKECGLQDDGCGAAISCGTCNLGEVCDGGLCVVGSMNCVTDTDCTPGLECSAAGSCILAQTGTGAKCAANTDCDVEMGICFADPSWVGGYCSTVCLTPFIGCASDGRCVSQGNSSMCLRACNSNMDCRQGYTCASRVLSAGGTATVCDPVAVP